MKLYFYSNELLTFVDAKWAIAKLVTGGILIGVVILLGFIKLNPSVGNALGFRSTKTLSSENNFLRQQVNLISDRVNKMEMQVKQLNKCADTLDMLFTSRKIEPLLTDKTALTHLKGTPDHYAQLVLVEHEVERVKSTKRIGGL